MSSQWPAAACIAVTALSGAVLILLTPGLVQSGDPGRLAAFLGLAVMVVGFGIAGRRLRPGGAGRR